MPRPHAECRPCKQHCQATPDAYVRAEPRRPVAASKIVRGESTVAVKWEDSLHGAIQPMSPVTDTRIDIIAWANGLDVERERVGAAMLSGRTIADTGYGVSHRPKTP